METIAKCLALNIKNLRHRGKMTQAQLAKKAGISLIFLQGIEAEKKWVSPQTAKLLAEALQVPETKLFENCFDKKYFKKQKRIVNGNLKHIPDDIYNSLATTCALPTWKWDAIRWIIQGFERGNLPQE